MLAPVEIRELRDEDVPAVVRILSETYPHDLSSVAGYKHNIATSPARGRPRRWVAVDEGTVVAIAGARLHLFDGGGKNGLCSVTVASGYRGRGLGSDLLAAALEHLREAGARRVITDSGHADGRRFLEQRGFRLTHTLRYSSIDPRSADFAALDVLRAEKQQEGFEVMTLADCRPEDVHAVDAEATLDIPFEAPITEIRFDEWLDQAWRHPLLSLDGSFAAAHEGRLVAITMARVDLAARRALNDMTGTLRAFRGRGLARLVKLAQLEWAAANGITSVVTDNDATNAPMLAVNGRLGYRPFHEVGSYVTELD
jgi:GNAT superfamily N-acetyltransferase